MSLRQNPVNNPLLVGVDVHRESNQVHVLDARGQDVSKPLRVRNNRPGVEGLARQLAALNSQGGYDGIRLATEATGWYWLGMFYTLEQSIQLPLQLYAINPRLTANYQKAMTSDEHTDLSDALVIAERLRMGRDLPPPFEPDTVYQPLRLLTRYRYHLTQMMVREKAYAVNLIYLKASAYSGSAQEPFSDVFGATSRAVLTEFDSCEALLAQPVEALAEWLDHRAKGRFEDPLVTARKLHTVARESFALPDAFLGPINLCIDLVLRQITAYETQRKRLDAVIAERVQTIPNTLDTIPGIGPVFAAGLLAEIGDIRRFDGDDDKVAKLAGFKWRRHQSADFEAEDTPLTRHCNRFLRYYFCEAANLVRIHEPDYAAFYKKKFNEVPKHQHKRAIVLTARKLVRLVTRLLTTHQPYRARRTHS